MKLYIVRHGQTLWNTERRLQGWLDSELTELGIENAQKLGQSLEKIKFHRIIASPSTRANRTAEIIQAYSGHSGNVEIETDIRLREIGLGDWEGKKIDEVEALDPDRHLAFTTYPEKFQVENGETFQEVYQRAAHFLNHLSADSGDSDENVLIVSHTVTIKAMLLYVMGQPLKTLWETPRLNPTCLTKVVYNQEDGIFKLQVIGDMSHATA